MSKWTANDAKRWASKAHLIQSFDDGVNVYLDAVRHVDGLLAERDALVRYARSISKHYKILFGHETWQALPEYLREEIEKPLDQLKA